MSITNEQRCAAVNRICATFAGWHPTGPEYSAPRGYRIRQRPVDELLGDKGLVRHDNLFAVPVADGVVARVLILVTASQVASDRIANTNRLLKQDDQARR